MSDNKYHLCTTFGGRCVVCKVKDTAHGQMIDSRTEKEIDYEDVLRTAAAVLLQKDINMEFNYKGKAYVLKVEEVNNEQSEKGM